jgi:photosystem II stability/assembly factor-like uncharacterized protein
MNYLAFLSTSSFRWLLLLVLLASQPARAQWVAQPFSFDAPEVIAYRFGVVDANVLWAVGYDENLANRSVALSTNGGQVWGLRPVSVLSSSEALTSISATSALNAWVSTSDTLGGGRLLHTTDGGLSWTAPAAPVFGPHTPNFVHFFSANEGVAVGDPGTAPADTFAIFVTRNGGLSWQPAASVPAALADENGVVLAPAVADGVIWFATDEGRVFTSSDLGDTWLAVISNTMPAEQYAVAFSDATHGITVSVDNARQQYVHASSDGGLTWQFVRHSGQLRAAGIVGVPGAGLLISVGSGELGSYDVGSSYSRDNGLTWTDLEATLYHTGVAAHSRTAIWSGALQLSGNGLGVYRLGATALASQAATRQARAAYPNPSATGEFRLPLPATPATVRLTDALGREILRTTTASGQPELPLNLRGYAPGLYVLALTTPTGTARQQLVLQ